MTINLSFDAPLTYYVVVEFTDGKFTRVADGLNREQADLELADFAARGIRAFIGYYRFNPSGTPLSARREA